MDDPALLKTPLTDAHVALGARMAPFAGYSMPIQYAEGVASEHRWTREHAGVFDVSHMGPAFMELSDKTGDPDTDHRAVAALIEPLVSGDIAGLKPGQLRYTLLLNAEGGIEDDLMIGRPHCPTWKGWLYIVANSGRKDLDFLHLSQAADGRATLHRADTGGLLALQGPQAHDVLAALLPGLPPLAFMQFRGLDTHFGNLTVSRSGYTGEDGYEVLVGAGEAGALWDALLTDPRVKPIGLGARDSLRLEAGLPLYGHDLDPTVSPHEAGLGFAVSKRRREAGDLPGAERLAREQAGDLGRVRVGLRVLSGPPAREGAEIADASGTVIGRVTSGGFSPTLNAGVALGFVPPAFAAPGLRLSVLVRGRPFEAEVVRLPFVPHRYVRSPA